MFGDFFTSIGELLVDFVTGLFRSFVGPIIEGFFGAPEEEELL